ncbi:MAG TPA: hypothetical protein VFG11_01985 [Acidobacteriota bacterium]|nr:hypothetical protein [Acidobacteriota bacterium]
MVARFRVLIVLLLMSLAAVSCDQTVIVITGNYAGTQNFGIGQVGSFFAISITQDSAVITGRVNLPFQTTTVPIMNGTMSGNRFQFDAVNNGTTFRYSGTSQNDTLMGNFEPLGCVVPSSGQPCLTDSNGTFTATKQ